MYFFAVCLVCLVQNLFLKDKSTQLSSCMQCSPELSPGLSYSSSTTDLSSWLCSLSSAESRVCSVETQTNTFHRILLLENRVDICARYIATRAIDFIQKNKLLGIKCSIKSFKTLVSQCENAWNFLKANGSTQKFEKNTSKFPFQIKPPVTIVCNVIPIPPDRLVEMCVWDYVVQALGLCGKAKQRMGRVIGC